MRGAYLFAIFLLAFGLANALTDVSSCQNLTTAGETYSLTQNISVNGSTCLNVTAENVTIDCAGYGVAGNNSASTYGIYSNSTNTSVRNCQISGFPKSVAGYGPYLNVTNTSIQIEFVEETAIQTFSDAHYAYISNVSVVSYNSWGVILRGDNSTLKDSNINVIVNGTVVVTGPVLVEGSANSTLENVTMRLNRTGTCTWSCNTLFFTGDSSGTVVRNSDVQVYGNSNIWGIRIWPNNITIDSTSIYCENDMCRALEPGGDYHTFNNNTIINNGSGTYASPVLFVQTDYSAFTNNVVQNLKTGMPAISFINYGSYNYFGNNTITSQNTPALQFSDGSYGNTLINNTFISSSHSGVYLTNTRLNNFTSNTFITTTGYASLLLNGARNETFTNNSFLSNSTEAIETYSTTTSTNNTFRDNYFSTNSTSLFSILLNSQSGNNTFYNNTFNSTKWISNSNSTNNFNYSVSGRQIGNKYYFFNSTPSWSVFNISDYDGDNFADGGSAIPFNASNVGGNWSGVGGDYHPYTTAYVACPNITLAGTSLKLAANVSINSSTCFNITTENVTLDCNGYSIAGNNSSNTYGVYSNATNTTVKNCIISNFDVGIYFNGADNGTILNNTVSSTNDHYAFPTYCAGILLYNGANYNLLEDNYAFSQYGMGIMHSTGSSFNVLDNNTANSTNVVAIDTLWNSNSNLIANSTAYCYGTGRGCMRFGEQSENNTAINTVSIGIASAGMQIYGLSNNNNLTNVTLSSNSSNALYIAESRNNRVINSTATSNATAVYLAQNRGANYAENNTISGTAISSSTIGILVHETARDNHLYHNSISAPIWINNSNETNHFNTTVAGKAQGNYYPNTTSYGAYDLDGDGFSDTNVTFNNTTTSIAWVGYGADYRPGAPQNLPPSAAFTISPEYAYPTSTVSCILTATDDFFSSLNVTYSLYKNGAAIQNGSQNITSATELASSPSNSAGDTIYCTATVSDPYNSTTITSTTRSVQALQPSGGQGSSGTTPPPATPPPATPPPTPPPTTPPVEVPSTPEQLSITVPANVPEGVPADVFITTYSGDPLYNAKVTITTPSGKIITTMTDANGKVQFFTDEPGNYLIETNGTSASTLAVAPIKEPTPQQVAQTVANISGSAAKPENAPAMTYSIAFIAAVIVLAGALAAYLLFLRKR